MLRRLNDIPPVQIEESRITGHPKITFAALRLDGHLDKFLETVEWMIAVAESDASSST